MNNCWKFQFSDYAFGFSLVMMVWIAMSIGAYADSGAGENIESRVLAGMNADRNGDSETARRIFLEVLEALDQRAGDHSTHDETQSIRRRLEFGRNEYPALRAALDYREKLFGLPMGKWVMLHEQKSTDAVRFRRQRHAGSAFDSRRGRLILFGSDTHGRDWNNSPLFFDPALGEWSRTYADDPVTSYTVDDVGIPVAGTRGDRPWAMHTFGAVCYDAARDQLIIASYPEHMKPGRFTDALNRIWGDVGRHPTWIFDLQNDRWRPLAGLSVSFFPYAAVYDSDRAVVIGYKTAGVYELSGSPLGWRKVDDPGLTGWHNNTVYDSRDKVVVVFGSHENSNDVVVYQPSTGRHRKMPTLGRRPPKAQHAPMAFHPIIGKTVVLVAAARDESSRAATTETWLYDFRADEWQLVETARLPFAVGMNYNLEYDSMRRILLFVASPNSGPTTVWSLRL